MKISANLINGGGKNEVILETNNISHSISIPPKSTGFGSSANGGELLFLAIAACYCNDIYREAEKRKIIVSEINVTVSGEFGAEGEPAKKVKYDVKIRANQSESSLIELIKYTDSVAEIHNSLRAGTQVTLNKIEIDQG